MNANDPTIPPWGHCFRTPGGAEPADIRLRQIGVGLFELCSALEYTGDTDVASPTMVAGPNMVTDLASVPGPLRWFVSPYGLHTPAALLHDRLVGHEAPPGFARSDADRLFRQMLDCLGVPFVRRWLMWSAVAFGTRWAAGGVKRVMIAAWTAAAASGMAAFAAGAATGTSGLLLIAVIVPVPSALLWGRQYGGGLVAAVCGLWLIPPTVLAVVGYGVYRVVEKLSSYLPRRRSSRQPSVPRQF